MAEKVVPGPDATRAARVFMLWLGGRFELTAFGEIEERELAMAFEVECREAVKRIGRQILADAEACDATP